FDAGVIVSSYLFGWGSEASLKDSLSASSGDILLLLGEKSRPASPSITRQEKLTSDVGSVLLRSSNPFYSARLAGAVRELVADGTTAQPVVVHAGGIMRAVLELCRRADRVVRVDVERMPRADSQMHARELLLSESGNRVVFIMSKDAYAASTATLRKWKVDATVIGEVIDGEGVQFCWNHRTVADIPLKRFLVTDVKREFELVEFPPMVKPTHKIRNRLPQLEPQGGRRTALAIEDEGKASFPVPEYLPDAWIDMLADPNLCSRRYLGNIIQSPEYIRSVAGERDAHVFPDWTRLDRDMSAAVPGVATALVGESLYMKSDAYLGTVHAVAEALRRLAAVGARPSALVGALSFGDPSKYRHLCDLAEATRALSDVGRVWGLSLLTEDLNLAIGVHGGGDLPTPGILAIGEVSDCRVSVPGGFVADGDVVLVLGTTLNEIACSEYARYYKHDLSSIIPELNFSSEENVRSVILTLVEKGLLQSAHSVGKGGIAVALAECCLIRPEEPIGANLFLALTFDPREYRADAVLFSETPGRFVVSCKKEHQAEIERICKQSSITISGKGDVGGRKIVMEGAVDLSLPLTTALKVWTNRLRNILNPV
ncbi:MAG: AIR synthase-related protein, partial [bacterium]|nr:AIR synthase-related protein [bacterium]